MAADPPGAPPVPADVPTDVPTDVPVDTKDWTWVLERRCPDCGFDAPHLDLDSVPALIHDNAMAWAERLGHGGVDHRPRATAWSALEYGAHVRDVHMVFTERIDLMLAHDPLDDAAPVFANWDQDAAALAGRYHREDPHEATLALVQAAARVAARYAGVAGDRWRRRGLRDNGSAFTLDTLCRYHLHDVVHHLWDVDQLRREGTVAAYESSVEAYAAAVDAEPTGLRADPAPFDELLPRGARLLEVGSGSGRDALMLEELGHGVRRTDITAGFVDRLVASGCPADLMDPLVDDLGGPWDGAWTAGVVPHLDRIELLALLERLAAATVPGGPLLLTALDGDGAAWEVRAPVAHARHVTRWREPALRWALGETGWGVEQVRHRMGHDGQEWIDLVATRRS